MEDRLIYTTWLLKHYEWNVINYDLIVNLEPKIKFDDDLMATIPQQEWEAARAVLLDLRRINDLPDSDGDLKI